MSLKSTLRTVQRIQKLHENFLYSVNTMSTVTSGQTQYKRAVEGGKNSTNKYVGESSKQFFSRKATLL